MSMEAEPDRVRTPNSWLMKGVSGSNAAVTRTEITSPGAWFEQVVPVHVPVGVVPSGGASTQLMLVLSTLPKGAIIRLAALGDVGQQGGVVGGTDRPTGGPARCVAAAAIAGLHAAQAGTLPRGLRQGRVQVHEAADVDRPEQHEQEDGNDERELDQALSTGA